ncbi:Ger(x)C family spore germination protein [Paenibacillus sp. CGMCC 1.16610]|uniref:Ger(X)C family spore germination protein n=1 Tax=Paenibacillus anseongense TaxID=2682845 RepID=A0ABW9UI66_9BACL|nr:MULTISPECIES: Ger(x)C family spore germination protein [Paenibacillus]MBA2941070.1 Ger(x)C family spore germination protein [Paenibacillus sp. CGMCC 1.16610]MVQ39889.1 Ger(x)C family spore germination protein [Paenibacillus anseongense]
MIRFFYFVVLIASLLLTGCVKQDVIDKITISFTGAFDEAPDDQIEFTIAATKFQADKSRTVSNVLYSKVGHTSKNILEIMDLQLNRPIKPGKISVLLIGKELAERGLADKLDVVLRDAIASRRMYVVIVDGKGKEMLQANFSSNEEKGMYLYNLLDTNVRTGLVPRQNLHDFEYAYLGKGLDPFFPLLTLQPNGQVQISGLALFKDDKYVLSLSEKQMRIMKLLLGNVRDGTLETKLENGPYMAIKNIGSKVNYRVGKESKSPKVTINLRLNAEVIDSKGIALTQQEQQRITESFEKDITTTGLELLQLFKKEEIDPLGLGDFVRSKTRKWNEEAWKEEYQTMNVKLNVRVDLTEIGIRK